jgi:hypothetical protein
VGAGTRGIYLISIGKSHSIRDIDPLPEPPESVCYEINGLSFPEENPLHRTAIKRFFELWDNADYPPISSYKGFTEANHTLEAEDGRIITLSGKELKTLANTNTDRSTIIDHHSYEHCGDTYSATITTDDLPGRIGELVPFIDEADTPDLSNSEEGIIAGFNKTWHEKEHIAPTSSGIYQLVFTLETLYITPEGTVTRNKSELKCINTSS